MVLDSAGRIQNLNQKSLDVLATRLDQVKGQDWYETFVPEEDRGPIRARFLSLMSGAEGEKGYAEYALVNSAGQRRHTVWYRRVLRDESGTVTGLLSVGFDDTDRKCLEEELVARALHDELTGLYNLRGFSEIAEQVLALARRSQSEAHVCFADVDNLKNINDTYGHHAGDAVLIAVAQCMRDVFRSADLLARVGGDEFAVLTLGQPAEASDDLLHRVQRSIEKASASDEVPSEISLSLGVAQVDLEHPDGLETALALADRSMYSIKQDRARETTDTA